MSDSWLQQDSADQIPFESESTLSAQHQSAARPRRITINGLTGCDWPTQDDHQKQQEQFKSQSWSTPCSLIASQPVSPAASEASGISCTTNSINGENHTFFNTWLSPALIPPPLIPGSPVSPNPFFPRFPLTPPPTLAAFGYFGGQYVSDPNLVLDKSDNLMDRKRSLSGGGEEVAVAAVNEECPSELKLKLKRSKSGDDDSCINPVATDNNINPVATDNNINSVATETNTNNDEEMIGLFMVALG